jgi:transposase
MADTPKRRPRRQFTDEFIASAVRLVLDEGKSVGAAARDLDLTETALREWVKRAQADRTTKGRTGLTTAEREELVRLRKALRIAEEERDISKKPRRSSRSRAGEVCLHRGEEGRASCHDSLLRIPAKMNARSGDGERRFRASCTLIGAKRRRQWVSGSRGRDIRAE